MQDTPTISVALIRWLFVTFTYLVNWLINFLEHLTTLLIEDFGVFAQPQFVIFRMQFECKLTRSCCALGLAGLRSGGQINTHDLPLLQKEK